MYTYIDDHKLYIMNPTTGKIYRIGMNHLNEPYIVHEDTMSFNADVDAKTIEKIAKVVRD